MFDNWKKKYNELAENYNSLYYQNEELKKENERLKQKCSVKTEKTLKKPLKPSNSTVSGEIPKEITPEQFFQMQRLDKSAVSSVADNVVDVKHSVAQSSRENKPTVQLKEGLNGNKYLRPVYSTETKQRVMDMIKQGKSYRAISKELGIPISSISWIKKHVQ